MNLITLMKLLNNHEPNLISSIGKHIPSTIYVGTCVMDSGYNIEIFYSEDKFRLEEKMIKYFLREGEMLYYEQLIDEEDEDFYGILKDSIIEDWNQFMKWWNDFKENITHLMLDNEEKKYDFKKKFPLHLLKKNISFDDFASLDPGEPDLSSWNYRIEEIILR